MRFRFLLSALLLALPLRAQTKVFHLDENHTVFGFKAGTLLFDVPGRFMTFRADIQGDPVTFAGAKVRREIDVKSLNTAVKNRDEHLRSDDFFDVAKYPKITGQESQGVRPQVALAGGWGHRRHWQRHDGLPLH